MRRYYRVYETGTDDYIEGPFANRADARETDDVEGTEQGQYVVVPYSSLPARLRRLT